MCRCLKLSVVFLVIAGLLYIGRGFILDKAGRGLYYKDELKTADVIVILAGEEKERVEYGVKLFNDGRAGKERIILTGGPVVWKYTWASLMEEQAVDLGVPKKNIILADGSRTTEEDALNTMKVMKKNAFRSCIVVTSPYHSRRAAVIFKKVMGNGVQVIIAPVEKSWFDFNGWWKRERDRAQVLNEYSKFLWLWISGFKNG